MRITILTLFPEMFSGPFAYSIVKRAEEKKLLTIDFINIRDFGLGKHHVVDDKPFGGGIGMIMRVDVLHKALQSAKDKACKKDEEQSILLDARGKTFNQQTAKNFSTLKHLILLCGHYEGVDERIRHFVDQTISIGDFILTGGEIPAMLVADATARLITGVLKEDATSQESFSQKSLEYPQYTLPRDFEGLATPEILLSGNHKEIEMWKKEKATTITKLHRPDLLS